MADDAEAGPPAEPLRCTLDKRLLRTARGAASPDADVLDVAAGVPSRRNSCWWLAGIGAGSGFVVGWLGALLFPAERSSHAADRWRSGPYGTAAIATAGRLHRPDAGRWPGCCPMPHPPASLSPYAIAMAGEELAEPAEERAATEVSEQLNVGHPLERRPVWRCERAPAVAGGGHPRRHGRHPARVPVARWSSALRDIAETLEKPQGGAPRGRAPCVARRRHRVPGAGPGHRRALPARSHPEPGSPRHDARRPVRRPRLLVVAGAILRRRSRR